MSSNRAREYAFTNVLIVAPTVDEILNLLSREKLVKEGDKTSVQRLLDSARHPDLSDALLRTVPEGNFVLKNPLSDNTETVALARRDGERMLVATAYQPNGVKYIVVDLGWGLAQHHVARPWGDAMRFLEPLGLSHQEDIGALEELQEPGDKIFLIARSTSPNGVVLQGRRLQ